MFVESKPTTQQLAAYAALSALASGRPQAVSTHLSPKNEQQDRRIHQLQEKLHLSKGEEMELEILLKLKWN